MAEAMAAMGLAIIAMKRNNACTRRIVRFLLLNFFKSKLLVKRKGQPGRIGTENKPAS